MHFSDVWCPKATQLKLEYAQIKHFPKVYYLNIKCIIVYLDNFMKKVPATVALCNLPPYFDEAKTEPTPFLEPLWKLILTTISVKYGMK